MRSYEEWDFVKKNEDYLNIFKNDLRQRCGSWVRIVKANSDLYEIILKFAFSFEH